MFWRKGNKVVLEGGNRYKYTRVEDPAKRTWGRWGSSTVKDFCLSEVQTCNKAGVIVRGPDKIDFLIVLSLISFFFRSLFSYIFLLFKPLGMDMTLEHSSMCLSLGEFLFLFPLLGLFVDTVVLRDSGVWRHRSTEQEILKPLIDISRLQRVFHNQVVNDVIKGARKEPEE